MCAEKRDEDIRRKIGDVQSIDGRTQSGRISTPVPSVKRMPSTGLNGKV